MYRYEQDGTEAAPYLLESYAILVVSAGKLLSWLRGRCFFLRRTVTEKAHGVDDNQQYAGLVH